LGEKLKLKNNIKLFITCDSGAGAGKTTASKYISKKYGLDLLTSGLLYRMVAKKLLDAKKNPKDLSFLKKITKNISHRDLNSIKLYSPKITAYTSEIAKLKKIRILLKNYQSKFAKKRLVIIEGRDIGTLFPKADIKFFFKCNLDVAGKRRFKELQKNNKNIKLADVKKAMRIRNNLDKKRAISPLIQAKNAVIVRTDKLKIQDMLNKMSKVIEERIKDKYGS
jgi:cytidylate kinase